MNKPNKTLSMGLLIVAIMLLLKGLSIQLPDFIEGLGLGTGITLELVGAYSINHDMSKFRNYKINFFKKCFNKLNKC